MLKLIGRIIHHKKRHVAAAADARKTSPSSGQCCICGSSLSGKKSYSPHGAEDDAGNTIAWKSEDRCCMHCYSNKVLPERSALYAKAWRKKDQ